MIDVFIPPSKAVDLKYLCLDLNGTIAFNKSIITGVGQRLERLKDSIEIYVLTADTFGNAAYILRGLPVKLEFTSESNQGESKAEFVRVLGSEYTAAIGNGYNDRLMLKEAVLSIAVTGGEGSSTAAITSALMAVNNINDALDLLIYPERIKATLRD